MTIVIDANMRLFADRMHISSSRMIRDYGLSSVEEIIEEEAKKGNTRAIDYARECYHSPEKLAKLFKLTDVENRYILIKNMDDYVREKLLPMLSERDLVMGLYFFTQEKLLKMMMKTDTLELLRVVLDAFPIEEIMAMYSEDDLAGFFMNRDLDKDLVTEQLKLLPPEYMQKFIEGVTGMPSENTDPNELIQNISNLPDDKFHKFMAGVDPIVQRQLVYQITAEEPETMALFGNEPYVNMMGTLIKPDMITPMAMLNKETLAGMISELPEDLMSIVAAQVGAVDFARFLQRHSTMDLIERALMV